jgi:hypothetical protein
LRLSISSHIQLTFVVLHNLLRALDSQQPALGAARISQSGLAPDIPQVAIAAARPLVGVGVLDIEASVEGHAVWRCLGAVDGALALVAHGRGDRLAGEEHGVDIGLAQSDNLIGDDGDEDGGEAGRVDVPLSDDTGKGIVEALKETHGRWLREARRGKVGDGVHDTDGWNDFCTVESTNVARAVMRHVRHDKAT